MVKYKVKAKSHASLDLVFGALSDPTRRALVERLSERPASVGELARPQSMSWPAVTKHLQVLERAGLVARRREGRVHRLSLRPEPMREAEAWIERCRVFWDGRLDALERYLEGEGESKDGEGDNAAETRGAKGQP